MVVVARAAAAKAVVARVAKAKQHQWRPVPVVEDLLLVTDEPLM